MRRHQYIDVVELQQPQCFDHAPKMPAVRRRDRPLPIEALRSKCDAPGFSNVQASTSQRLFPGTNPLSSGPESYAGNPVKLLFRIIAFALLFVGTFTIADEADIEGRWLSGDGSGWIDIRLVNGKPVGTAAGSTTAKKGDPPRLDDLNPDPTLRERSLQGITILHGFEYKGDHVWKGGTIYDPNSGKTYKSSMTLLDQDTLKVRGFIGISLFGRSDIWTRDDL